MDFRPVAVLLNTFTSHVNLGVLPFDGDLRSQPAWVAHTIETLTIESSIIEAEMARNPRGAGGYWPTNPLTSAAVNIAPTTNKAPPKLTFTMPVPRHLRPKPA
jgi:hypothetical protein